VTLFDVVASKPELIRLIQTSVSDALKIYARSEIVPRPHCIKPHVADSEITVVGMLDIKESNDESMMSLGFPNAVFVKIYENLFHEELSEASLEAADLAGELINIIFETIDPQLRALGHRFDVSLPKVVTQSNLQEWRDISAGESLLLPFSTGWGDIVCEVFVMKGAPV
jgi:CheY-specific phosphatase CheX